MADFTEKLHLVMQHGNLDSLQKAVLGKIAELVGDEADQVFVEYIMVMLNNRKTLLQLQVAIEELVGEEPAVDYCSWFSSYVDELYHSLTREEVEGHGEGYLERNEPEPEGQADDKVDDGGAEAMDETAADEDDGSAPHRNEDAIPKEAEGAQPQPVDAATRILMTAIEQSVKSTKEAPRTVYKTPRTHQGPPPEEDRIRGRGGHWRGGRGRERPPNVRMIQHPHVVFTVTGIYNEQQLRGILTARQASGSTGGRGGGRSGRHHQHHHHHPPPPPHGHYHQQEPYTMRPGFGISSSVYPMYADVEEQHAYFPPPSPYYAAPYQRGGGRFGYGPVRGRGGYKPRPASYHPYHSPAAAAGGDVVVTTGSPTGASAMRSRGGNLSLVLNSSPKPEQKPVNGPFKRSHASINPATGHVTHNKVWVRNASSDGEAGTTQSA